MFKTLKTFVSRVVCALGRSPRWYSLRCRTLQNANGCEACTSQKALQVHHVKPVYTHPELELDPSNLLVLCRTCHLLIGHGGSWMHINPMARDSADTLRANPQLRATILSVARKVSVRMVRRP